MISWLYIAVFAIVLLLFMLWQEMRREDKRRLAWRIMASTIAIAALTALAYPMLRNTPAHDGSGNEVVLLTQGYYADSVARFLARAQTRPSVYVLDQNLLAGAKPFGAVRTDPEDLFARQHPRPLQVFGEGLSAEALLTVKDIPLSFHPSPTVSGLQSVSWTHQLAAGQPLRIQGAYENTGPAAIKLVVEGLHALVDSVSIPAHSVQAIDLTAVPKFTGRAIYHLIAVTGSDTLENDPLPVEVKMPAPVNVLLLASAPDFENKFLKNWLSQQGFAVSVQTLISTNKYDRQYLNTAKPATSRLSASYLAQFDVVVTDAAALTALGKPELETLRQEVGNKGLGMVIRMDSTYARDAFFARPFPLLRTAHAVQTAFVLNTPDSVGRRFSLSLEAPVYIHRNQGTQVLLQDNQGNVFISSTLYGAGKMVASTLPRSYGLVLSGNAAAYATLWSQLLAKAARTTSQSSFRSSPLIPFPGTRMTLYLETNGGELPGVVADSQFVRVTQSNLLLSQWQGTYWPAHAGWQQLQNGSQLPAWMYVYEPGAWKNLLTRQHTADTRNYVQMHPLLTETNAVNNSAGILHALRIYLFIACIFCCGFLWMEQKM